MKEHVIEEHKTKDSNDKFSCDDCGFKVDKREKLLNHFRSKHQANSRAIDNNNIESNDNNLKEENRQLRSNFERLNTLFQDSLEELESVKAEYTTKLNDAIDKYRETMKENEELKEEVDILLKLSRSYINKVESAAQTNYGDKSRVEESETTTGIEEGRGNRSTG